MPPISRREQLELDELLGDIYRGIETLPDKSQVATSSTRSYDIVQHAQRGGNKSPAVIGHAHVREYELPESSPLVQQHQQELAKLRASNNNTNQQPERYTLKRQTSNAPDNDYLRNNNNQYQQQTQSLASFLNENPVNTSSTGLTSVTPDNKRRVRIVDHPDKLARASDDDYVANDYYDEPQANTTVQENSKKHRKERVKYVNTNKFIYHQEKNPDDPVISEPEYNQYDSRYVRENQDYNQDDNNNNNNYNDDDDDDNDDFDGKTRVEYYHTSWLDRQLGRASKRRSSKELNERQVKEKAMIEELKRNLKNGAITLRQSFKGKNHKKKSHDDLFDGLDLDNNQFKTHKTSNTHSQQQQRHIKDSPSKVIRSGLATVPRNYNNKPSSTNNYNKYPTANKSNTLSSSQHSQRGQYISNYNQPLDLASTTTTTTTPKQTTLDDDYNTNTKFNQQFTSSPMQTVRGYQDYSNTQSNYSRTLPHKKSNEQHQLIQSHYRGTLNRKLSPTLLDQNFQRQTQQPTPSNYSTTTTTNNQQAMNYPTQNNSNKYCNSPSYFGSGTKSPSAQYNNNSQQQQQQPSSTISGMPSATEVVRTALSRSNSQISLNQLNKTINLLPQSPPAPSPVTPTQQLRPVSPSLSPSPNQSRLPYNQHQYSSKTLGYQKSAASPVCNQAGQIIVHGTRTIGHSPQNTNQQQQQQQQMQPVYANPHASLMQHRVEQQQQQQRQQGRNTNSIREFNELDSLLRSLSPGTSTYNTPAQNRPSVMSATNVQGGSGVSTNITPGYSRQPVQPAFGGYMSAKQPQQLPTTNASDVYARVQKPTNNNQTILSSTHQPYTIDVTDKKVDENCIVRQKQNLSEFEPPIEILPSMEDYQNIAKLNPVKNYFWYKPNMTRDRAISLLIDKPQGTFIVRDSTSFKGAYGLAVKVAKLPKTVLANMRNTNGDQSSEYIRHFLIEPTGNSGVRLRGYANEPVFDSLPDLIYQHSLTELALPCRLLIPRADIEDVRFNQKQKQFIDDFIDSKAQAKHQPYERTSPDGGYRKYPGDVLIHNEHRIIFN